MLKQQNHNRQTQRTWPRGVPAIGFASALLMLLLSISFTPAPLRAAPHTTALVRIDPAVVTTTTTLTVPVNIVVENVNGLYGSDVKLAFDPALLAVQDADPNLAGIQIELGPLLTSSSYFVVINTVDNLSGTARLAITQLNPTLPVTGSGVLASITFTPTGATGASLIHLTQVQLANRDGDIIPATTQDGSVNFDSGKPRKFLYLPLIRFDP
jgi:hypothetical protein